ncbi:hypothetical protein GCM10027020_14460 [Nocardioides salsibiostraticola]
MHPNEVDALRDPVFNYVADLVVNANEEPVKFAECLWVAHVGGPEGLAAAGSDCALAGGRAAVAELAESPWV